MTDLDVMRNVADEAVKRLALIRVALDYPGYVNVIDRRGRHYNILFDGAGWAIDAYRNEAEYLLGSSPTATDDLDIPAGTTDPKVVADAIVRFVLEWDGNSRL